MNDSVLKTLGVAFAICMVCSLIVSFAAVSLRDLQKENAANNKSIKILQAAKMYDNTIDVKSQFQKLEMRYVDFDTGKVLKSYKDFKIEEYDQIKATRDSTLSTALSASDDIAIIKNRENVGKFFIVRDEQNNIDKLILPIRGYGLWGTLFGYVAIEEDFNTVAGLEFYEHKETPGLGAEVDNPRWKALWPGKKIYKDNEVQLSVIKGKVQSDDINSNYKVDGLSGATLTSRGVTNMITYWFGDSGYSKLFKELDYES
jgi:Na+-transporting NADH:ubiquinone oxidoreductase subunit C|tara:strand:+ start:1705 stop:2478 length:774 start_codon:yes stop_codon:yes gene_type:complete